MRTFDGLCVVCMRVCVGSSMRACTRVCFHFLRRQKKEEKTVRDIVMYVCVHVLTYYGNSAWPHVIRSMLS